VYPFEMILDPKWLDALKLPLKATIGIALSSGLLLYLDLRHLLDLGPLGAFTRPILIILSVVFTVLSVVGILDQLLLPLREKRQQSVLAARRAIRRKEEEEQIAAEREQVIARLDHLSKEEIRYVAGCLRNGSPSFYTYVFSPPVSMLQGKQLVWTPGGQHHQDHYPFSFHDSVWKELLARKEEFIAKDDEHKRAEETAKQAERQRRRY
jgi:hypothetical protein